MSVRLFGSVAVILVLGVEAVHADVFNMSGGLGSVSLVLVDDAGNLPDPATSGLYGSVGYNFEISTCNVTTAQYTEFLNAVAQTDPYGLYNDNMANDSPTLGITRSGSSGNYSYSVIGNGHVPVFDVTWGDAARFCNWLQNGQLAQPEGPATTETGAYALNGAKTQAALMAVASPAHSGSGAAKYFLPTENEFYKAAYYMGGGTASGYWTYPTQSNSPPSNTLGPAANSANYYNGGYTDPTNYLTPVGGFTGSPGHYQTYDMGGNVWQWSETVVGPGLSRSLRGGSFDYTSDFMASSYRYFNDPASISEDVGFRVAASVPEPGSMALLLAGAAAWAVWRRRRSV